MPLSKGSRTASCEHDKCERCRVLVNMGADECRLHLLSEGWAYFIGLGLTLTWCPDHLDDARRVEGAVLPSKP